jgi:hypothetical protein
MSIRPWAWALLAPSGLLAQPATAPVSGIWQAEGYGTIWEFAGDTLQSWEVTTTTCVRAGRYARAPALPPGAGVAFLDGVVTAWIIRPGATSRRFVAHSPGTASDVVFHQRSAIPSVCRPPTSDTREGNFAVFERTMAEQYAFFSLRGLDWSAQWRGAGSLAWSADCERSTTSWSKVRAARDRHTDVMQPTEAAPHYRRSRDRSTRRRSSASGPTRPALPGRPAGDVVPGTGCGTAAPGLNRYSDPAGIFVHAERPVRRRLMALAQALDSIAAGRPAARSEVDIRMNGGVRCDRCSRPALPEQIISRSAEQTRSDPQRSVHSAAGGARSCRTRRYAGSVVLLPGPTR